MVYRLLVSAIVSGLLCSCGAHLPSRSGEAAPSKSQAALPPAADGGPDAGLGEAERLWKERDRQVSLQRAIEIWERLAATQGDDARFWLRLARAFHLAAELLMLECEAQDAGGSPRASVRETSGEAARPDGAASPGAASADGSSAGLSESAAGSGVQPAAVELDCDHGLRDRAQQLLARGQSAAEKALALAAPALERWLRQADFSANAPSESSEQAMAALYWRTINLHTRAAVAGYAESVASQEEVRAAMDLCLKRMPGYDYGGPHRFFGALRAEPYWLGKLDLGQSRVHFESAIAIAPGYLANRLQYARYYAVAAQDPGLFREQLERVARGEPGGPDDFYPENRLQRSEAARLLARAAELFE